MYVVHILQVHLIEMHKPVNYEELINLIAQEMVNLSL